MIVQEDKLPWTNTVAVLQTNDVKSLIPTLTITNNHSVVTKISNQK